MAVDNMCKVAKEMSTLIGDSQLAARMDEAAELLKRPILSTQSLYFEWLLNIIINLYINNKF